MTETYSSETQQTVPGGVLFIVGNSRSGTTLLGRMLTQSGQVFVFRELHFFERLWTPGSTDVPLCESAARHLYSQLLFSQRQGFMHRPSPSRLRELAKEIPPDVRLEGLASPRVFDFFLKRHANGVKPGARPCEKTPRNVLYARDILQHFPDAMIVNLVRDPRDVLVSQKNKWKRVRARNRAIRPAEALRLRMNYHPVTMSLLWCAAVKSAQALDNHPRVLSLRFEDLVRSPQQTVRSVCALAGIDFDPTMLHVPQLDSSTRPDSHLPHGPNPERAHAWSRTGGLDSAEIFICQQIAGALLKRHGYESVAIFPNPLLLAWHLFTFPFKALAAALANLSRVKSLFQGLRRRMCGPS